MTDFRTGATRAAILGAALFAASAYPGDATAGTERTRHVSATGVCEAPKKSDNATLRKRPLAILNDGNANVTVSCSLSADFVARTDQGIVSLVLKADGPAREVACTLIYGVATSPVYVEKRTSVGAGAYATLTWDPVKKNNNGGTYNVSCLLPPGVELGRLSWTEYDTAGRI